ncbi:hypothetical protein [Streptomyces brevispora]|uniref:PASTA domain-containing protein n=1 Tax=Streptomyces brevispora TaxID=887462 RepID=A0ABZ1GEA8_9ACTN|nr:hypothetical protein [Streptomyces brevispora]WSC18135.1 hypothetical protein OIE64_01660 [Streptomyces brevispora]
MRDPGGRVARDDDDEVPTALREIAATSTSALPSSVSLTEPAVSMTTETRGGGATAAVQPGETVYVRLEPELP